MDSRAMASTLVRVVLRPADLPQLFPGLPTRNTSFRWHLALCPKKCKSRHFFPTVSSFQSIATNDMTHICKLLYVNIMFDDLCHQTQKYSDGQRISLSSSDQLDSCVSQTCFFGLNGTTHYSDFSLVCNKKRMEISFTGKC